MIIIAVFFFLQTSTANAGDFAGCGVPVNMTSSPLPNLPGPSCWSLPKYSTEDQKALAQRQQEYLERENLPPQEILARFLFAEAFFAQAYQSPDFPLVMETIGISLFNRISILKKFPAAAKWFGELTLPEKTPDQQAKNLLQLMFMPGEYHITREDPLASKYFLCPLMHDLSLPRPLLEYYQQAEKIAEKLLAGKSALTPFVTSWETKHQLSLATDLFFPKISATGPVPEKIATMKIDKRLPPSDYVVLIRGPHENDF